MRRLVVWSPIEVSASPGRRRTTVRHLGFVLAAIATLGGTASAEPRHGLSVFGELKYEPDFTHFDYVNPEAPKGGKVSQIGSAGRITFDSFNNFILKGDAAQGLELVFDTLMTPALDEPETVYGLIAKSADVAADGRSVTFQLRPEAKFADGTPVTAEDAAFSFVTLKEKGHPRYRLILGDVEKAEAIDAATVRYTFKGDLVRDLPIIVASLPVLSKAYYTANDFEKTSLEPPLGSGPYRIGDFKAGTFVSYVRRSDYWANDLAVNRGQNNFDEIRYEYYRDRTLELESLKAGNYDFREEFTSRDWATGYNSDAVKDGRLIRATIPDERPSGAQGFFVNTRRAKFADRRVREAMGLAFDFEWSNRNLFFGLYTRTTSFFENSDMKASGPPSPEELALLEPHRASLPPDVFGDAYVPPVTDGSGNIRDNLKKARELLTAAGWSVVTEEKTPSDCGAVCKLMLSVGLKSKDVETVVRNASGETLDVEILIFEEGFERIIGPYIKNLKAIGINASLRRVDPAQYEQRLKTFDFDMSIQRYSLRLTPGVELKNFWGSAAAKTDGSFNLAGIADPVVDALVEKIILAKSRSELVAATRAVDRVLRSGHYWVPHWYKGVHNIVYWDKFGFPAVKPKYDRGALATWWYDAAKAEKLKSR
ncbi:MAG: extracellular solute-binding protein [Hyphomicrobium sp.]